MISARSFWRDLLKAAAAWKSAPALPILSFLLVLPAEAVGVLPRPSGALVELLVGTPFLLFGIGWVGTQRIWYERIFDGATLNANEVWDLSWRFFPRYFVLGALVATPIFALVFGVLFSQIQAHAVPFKEPLWVLIVFLLYWFIADVVLTFVTPALAYTTGRVSQACGIGIEMLRQTWPSSAVYALLPPLTLLALGTVNPSGFRPEVSVTITIVSALIGLLTKGAIASFYLDQVRVAGPSRATALDPSGEDVR